MRNQLSVKLLFPCKESIVLLPSIFFFLFSEVVCVFGFCLGANASEFILLRFAQSKSWLLLLFSFFCQSWKCFSHCFLKYTFSPAIYLLCWWNSVDICNKFRFFLFVSVLQVLKVLRFLFVSLFSVSFFFVLQIG